MRVHIQIGWIWILLGVWLCLHLLACGDMGRVSNQSYHCMTEGGDDYCRPAPRGTSVQGPAGPQGSQGIPGDRGPAGTDGRTGDPGSPGESGYSIVSSSEGILEGDFLCPAGGTRLRIAQDSNRSGEWEITDSQQQILSICDGKDGSDGVAGATGPKGDTGAGAPPSPLTPVEIVDPCGDASGVYDEVFIRMANGILLASFSDNSAGKNTRFSVLVPGSYQTTDGSNCHFQVDSHMEIVNAHY